MTQQAVEREQKSVNELVLECVDSDIAATCKSIGEGKYPLELPLQMQIARHLAVISKGIKDNAARLG